MEVLSHIPMVSSPDLLVGTETGDDAGVYRLGDDTALVLTVDFFPPIVDDPFSFGAISVANSLSDIYAMGGRPLLGLNIVGFPVSLPKDILGEVLRGGYSKAEEAGCLIIGGHTVDDPEPKYGLAAVGLVEPGKEITNAGARPGDKLVLTKPLGTGIITTAGKQGVAATDVLDGAIATMGTLNRAASEVMVNVGVNSCTDVTGFGLVGHLNSMMKASNTSARIQFSKVPFLPGARALVQDGVAPGGTHRNLNGPGGHVLWAEGISKDDQLLLCDAQTSGGLLISVPEAKADQLVHELEAAGVEASPIIGEVLSQNTWPIEVVL